jgi:uncharacterized protein (TIGR02246 family)
MNIRPFLLALGFFSSCLPFYAAIPADDGEAEIRLAVSNLEQALQASDHTAWVYAYTEDAVFVGPGEPAVQGRAALLEMARTMTPLTSLKINVIRTEHSGSLAYVYARGSWVTGTNAHPLTTRVRTLLVFRKEADGKWRVTQELMHADPETPAAT